MINQHRTWAIEWRLLGEDAAGPNDLTPLMMPEELYFRRRRPSMTERAWQVFGEPSPYTVIPVVLHRVLNLDRPSRSDKCLEGQVCVDRCKSVWTPAYHQTNEIN